MNEHQIRLFDTNLNIGLRVSIPKLGRFRVSVFRQRGLIALSLETFIS
jgi:twitching motility protein PilU